MVLKPFQLEVSMAIPELVLASTDISAVLSSYQRIRVEHVCRRLGLVSLAYLWQRNQVAIMCVLLDNKKKGNIHQGYHLGFSTTQHLWKRNERNCHQNCSNGDETECVWGYIKGYHVPCLITCVIDIGSSVNLFKRYHQNCISLTMTMVWVFVVKVANLRLSLWTLLFIRSLYPCWRVGLSHYYFIHSKLLW